MGDIETGDRDILYFTTALTGSHDRHALFSVNTRMYFSDETAANAEDPVLNSIEWEVRRKTLIAQREQRDGQVVYRFDIRFQGDEETVFFDI